MQSLPQKLEAACKSLIDAAGVSVPVTRDGETSETAVTVFTGLSQEEKALPSVTIAVLSGQEFPQDSGNFSMNVAVEVRSNADETDLVAHRQFCEDALEPVMQDDTADQLSQQNEDLGVMGISNRQSRERVEDRTWVTDLSFDAYCCGQALA